MPGDEREDHTVEGAVGLSNRSAACSDANERLRATFAISDMKRARKKRKACVPSPSESPWRRASTPYSRPSTSACRDELIAAHRARGVEMAEEQIAHADTALAEPAERVSSKREYQSCAARSTRTRLRNSAETRSAVSPSAVSDCRRACRGRGSIASIEERMNLRCPPGVVKTSIFPESAQRRSVSGSTPRIRLASPASASHRAPEWSSSRYGKSRRICGSASG